MIFLGVFLVLGQSRWYLPRYVLSVCLYYCFWRFLLLCVIDWLIDCSVLPGQLTTLRQKLETTTSQSNLPVGFQSISVFSHCIFIPIHFCSSTRSSFTFFGACHLSFLYLNLFPFFSHLFLLKITSSFRALSMPLFLDFFGFFFLMF